MPTRTITTTKRILYILFILSEFEWRGLGGDSSDGDRIPEGERFYSNISWGVGREKAQEEAHMDRAQDQEAGETW